MAGATAIKEVAKQSSTIDAARRVPAFVLPAITASIVIADAFLAALSLFIAFTLRQAEPVLSATAWAWSQEFVPYAGVLFFAMSAVPLLLAYQGVYRFQGPFNYSNDATRIFKAVAIAALLIAAWAFLFRGGYQFREFSYSRGVFIINFPMLLLLVVAFHAVVRVVQTRFRHSGINLIPAIVVGTTVETEKTIRELEKHTELGYRVIGILTVSPEAKETLIAGKPVIGDFEKLPALVREYGVREVVITETTLSSDTLFEMMMQIGRARRVEFRYAPSLFELLPQKTSVDQIGVLPMVRLFREPLSDGARFVKRVSDIFIAAVAMSITLPLWIISAVAIKIGSRGPILFKQERVGMDGRVFHCYKFRTMVSDAEEDIHRDAYKRNISSELDANIGDNVKPVFGKVKDDERITKAGRWLRRFSIDELPQFLNVIKGDMSVVGPRPPIPYEVEEYELRHRKRLDMKPGITGLWQVSGRNRLPFEEMVRIDLYYIENWSLLLDLKIILLTIPAIVRGDGAR